MPVIVCGDIRFDSTVRNPWLSLELTRLLREHVSIASLAEPLQPDEEYLAPALGAAGFDAICLAPGFAHEHERVEATRELLESNALKTVGFKLDSDPYEPTLAGAVSIVSLVDRELEGFAFLDSPKSFAAARRATSGDSVVYVELTRKLSEAGRANLKEFRRCGSNVVIRGGRTPGRPAKGLAPGVFYDATRHGRGRPGFLAILNGPDDVVIKILHQEPSRGAMTRLVESTSVFACSKLGALLNLTKHLGLDARPFRASSDSSGLNYRGGTTP